MNRTVKVLASCIAVLFYLTIVSACVALSDTTDDATGTISAHGDNASHGEGAPQAFDNNVNTKWLDFSPTYSWIQYKYAFGKRSVVTSYTITSANDYPERDPKNWNFLGSNDDGATWVTLDSRTNQAWTARYQKKSFTFTNSTAYNIYRLEITAISNPSATEGKCVQLSEIEFIGTVPQPPSYAIAPNPSDSATNASATAALSWTAGYGTQSHDVYFGTVLSDVNSAQRSLGDLSGDGIVDWLDVCRLTEYWLANPEGTEPYAGVDDDNIVNSFDFAMLSQDWMKTANSVFKGNQDSNSFNPGTLALNTTYYWRIDEVNGPTTVRGAIWSFTTQSGKAYNPAPVNIAQYVDINPTLSWSAGTGAQSHQVYFGTANPPEFQVSRTVTTFNPGTLTPNTTYYWRVDEVGDFGTVQGDVWTFTTTDPGNTLVGKIMCGYQGWFACPGDGSGRSWAHWANGGTFSYTNLKIEMWPDMNEYANKYVATGFTLGNPPYYVFSSYNSDTQMVHFRWMQEYGIDGVFVQRFGSDFGVKDFLNTVLTNCKNAANAYGRKYAVMYDLTGYTSSSLASNIETDWLDLENNYGITTDSQDESYIIHKGKPVIAIYGVFGTNVSNYPNPSYVVPLLDWFRSRGFTILLGVNNDWLGRCDTDTNFKACIDRSDIIMPWNVGRYATTQDVTNRADGLWTDDLNWCNQNDKEYLICVFPGFSWHNWNGGSFDAIPRRGGQFLWEQYYNAKRIGATMIYQAMFDEVDESSAIFKVTNDPPPPSGNIQFLTLQGLPSDEYLWLCGQGTRMLRGEITLTATRPARP